MRQKQVVFLTLAGMLIVLLSFLAIATGDIQCIFYAGASCPAGNTKFLGIANDTGGFQNAHAQNRTVGTYAYSFCCNNTNVSITHDVGCGTTFLRLSSEDNAHVEGGNNSNYPVLACMNSTFQAVTCAYTAGSCGAGSTCLLSMANSDNPLANFTNAHIGNCSEYSMKACCGLSNNAPSAPALVYPLNGNTSVLERYVNFTWNASTDPESNPITYTINATCGASCTCSSFSVGSLSGINYTSSSELCIDVVYNWTVTACDNYNACNTSAQWNFTIASILDFVLIVNSTDFGGMAPAESKQTSATLQALVGRNNGNVRVNATINASALFTSSSFPSSNYLYKSADNESGSIVAGCSQTTLAQMSASQSSLFCNLSWADANDEAKIDLNVTVPGPEPVGAKVSTIIVEYESAE